MSSEGRNVAQVFVAGTLGAPPVFATLLLVIVFLLGWSIAKMDGVSDNMKRLERDLMLIREDLRNTNLPTGKQP